MRPIDAEALKHKRVIAIYGNLEQGLEEREVVYVEDIDNAPTIEAKPVVHAHWISAIWEEDEEDGIENTYSDEFICSNCTERLYFPDAIEKEDIEFSFCPHCGAQMDEKPNYEHPQKGVKIPVLYISDIPSALEEIEARKRNEKAKDELI